MINGETTYIYLLSDPMSQFTMLDLQVLNNVKLVNKHKLFKNKVLNILSKSHLSLKANEFYKFTLKKKFGIKNYCDIRVIKKLL